MINIRMDIRTDEFMIMLGDGNQTKEVIQKWLTFVTKDMMDSDDWVKSYDEWTMTGRDWIKVKSSSKSDSHVALSIIEIYMKANKFESSLTSWNMLKFFPTDPENIPSNVSSLTK